MNLKERFRLSRFVSGEKAVDTPVALNHRRIFILPTQRGLGFVVLIVLLLLIAFVYNNNLAYMLAFLLASIFFITILHSYKSLSGLVVQKGRSKAVFAGEAAGFDIHINNPTDTERHHLQIALQDSQSLTLQAQSAVHITLYSITQKEAGIKRGRSHCPARFHWACFAPGRRSALTLRRWFIQNRPILKYLFLKRHQRKPNRDLATRAAMTFTACRNTSPAIPLNTYTGKRLPRAWAYSANNTAANTHQRKSGWITTMRRAIMLKNG